MAHSQIHELRTQEQKRLTVSQESRKTKIESTLPSCDNAQHIIDIFLWEFGIIRTKPLYCLCFDVHPLPYPADI